ncbi:MAG: SseB family protein [Gammaproteobacteria bacterium]
MTERFEARNELEQKLMAAQEGSLPESEFMHYLLEAQVFMPVRDSINIAGFTGSDKAIPLTLHTEDVLEALVLFTSPDRAKNFVQDYPGYEGGLLVEFKWVLERTGSGVGISLNPNWPVGMDLEAEMVQQLRSN